MQARMPIALAVLVVAASFAGCHEGETSDPCSGVTCSDHGRCAEDGERAWCECDPGYAPSALDCHPASADGDVDGDVDADGGGDADADQGIDCYEATLCILECANEVCASDCTDRVCSGSVEAFAGLLSCADESCTTECETWNGESCMDCMTERCRTESFLCQSAGC
jgi:hypothetical protein